MVEDGLTVLFLRGGYVVMGYLVHGYDERYEDGVLDDIMGACGGCLFEDWRWYSMRYGEYDL